MASRGIPTRKEENYLSEMVILSANPTFDLFLFVEDETSPWAYKQIIDRIFNKEVCVGKVFPLKAKNSVIKTYKEWSVSKKNQEKCMFIIDKDFDYWQEESISDERNVLELPCYTLENLLFDKQAANHLVEINARGKDIDDIIEPDFLEKWIMNIYEGLRPLFIDFALIKKEKISKESTSQNPDRYINEEGDVKESEIEKYNKEVIEIFGREGIDYQNSREEMTDFFRKADCIDYNSLIKGKYLLHALVKKVNFLTKTRIKTPIDNTLMSLLIFSVKVENFRCIEEKYHLLKS